MTNTSSGFADYLVRELRVASLKARLVVNELQFAGIALKAGLIDPDSVLEHLADVGVLGFVITPSSSVSPP
jgi:hypothetical protein